MFIGEQSLTCHAFDDFFVWAFMSQTLGEWGDPMLDEFAMYCSL